MSRATTLAVVFAGLAALSSVVLFDVLGTVLFGITLAYVLFPVRTWATDRGASPRLAAATATTLAFVGAVAFVTPVLFVVYQRRQAAVRFVQSLPDQLTLRLGETTYVIETAPLVARLTGALGDLAVLAASVAPVLALESVVLVLVVFALLYRPEELRRAIVGVVPADYHDVVAAYHRRARRTLQAIYVLQAATAAGTFLLAFVVFLGFGYRSPVFLAVVAGLLQFIPVVGPSLLVLVLVVVELAAGELLRAGLLAVVGLVVIGFLPDAVIRTRLAGYAAGLPVSLYFVGFVGGVLTVGAVGFVLGPLVVALLAETVSLLSAEADRPPTLPVDDAPETTDSAAHDDANGGDR